MSSTLWQAISDALTDSEHERHSKQVDAVMASIEHWYTASAMAVNVGVPTERAGRIIIDTAVLNNNGDQE